MRRNVGFTLIELSIVLVIVGLLIGGILVAKSMIASAKLNAFVRQIQQYDIAMDNFKIKYNGIPGDSSLFNSVGYTPYKNNNRLDIENSGGIAIHGFYTDTNETGNVWLDMQKAAVIDDGNTYVAHNSGGAL
jgi:prepilin-type N-terminal cleavage/methylation domain-containing protein